MSDIKLGTPFGTQRTATIRKYNNDGTVKVALDEAGLTQSRLEFNIPVPAAWTGTAGEFLGGYPKVGSAITVQQGQGGVWSAIGYKGNPTVFADSSNSAAFKPDRILGQVKGGTRFFLDPISGFEVGKENNSLQVDPNQGIFSSNLDSKFEFTSAKREVIGEIKRDALNVQSKSYDNNFLESHNYDNSLYTIGFDPSITTSPNTVGGNIRNIPMVESKELVYEFSNNFNFNSYHEESTRYADPSIFPKYLRNSRRENRTDAFSLSLEYPNHLIETIKGTGVDIFGNVLDLNRNILPIGKINNLSLLNDPNKSEAFKNIAAQLRKSIAYHFEINTRKEFESNDLTPPDPSSTKDFARARSKFFVDIDKEGQFKINVPASSETGNIPLLTRYENYSVLASKEDNSVDPNGFVVPANYQDIYLDSFAANQVVKLTSGEDDLDGYGAPLDHLSNKPMKLGTPFHDISKVCSESLTTANYLQAGMKLVNFDPDNSLNTTFKPFKSFISDTIITNGSSANGGGRSGTMNFDGSLSLSLGANTVDRQSLWLDLAGGMVSSIGRDKNGISSITNYDGSVYIQVGGPGLPSNQDSRFESQDSSYNNGVIDIKLYLNGQLNIIRIDGNGMSFVTPGSFSVSAQQDIILRSNSNILMQGELIVAYAESEQRILSRTPSHTTIG